MPPTLCSRITTIRHMRTTESRMLRENCQMKSKLLNFQKEKKKKTLYWIGLRSFKCFSLCVCVFFIVNQEAIKQLYLPNQNIHEYILFSVCLFLTVNGKRCPQSMHRAQNAIYWQNWPWRGRRKRKKHQTIAGCCNLPFWESQDIRYTYAPIQVHYLLNPVEQCRWHTLMYS